MKLLFLDIDGVLNSEQYIRMLERAPGYSAAGGMIKLELDPVCVSNLKYIFDCTPSLELVIHSSRRNWFSKELFEKALDLPVFRIAPKGDKSYAIKKFLNDYDHIRAFVILEDNGVEGFRENTVFTNPALGLTIEDAKLAVAKLGGKNDGGEYVF